MAPSFLFMFLCSSPSSDLHLSSMRSIWTFIASVWRLCINILYHGLFQYPLTIKLVPPYPFFQTPEGIAHFLPYVQLRAHVDLPTFANIHEEIAREGDIGPIASSYFLRSS